MTRLRFALVCVAMTATFSYCCSSAHADGSWGSSRGGFSSFGGGLVSGGSGGSGGSYGCRGGLFSNAPVRSLLSRVGGGIADILDRKPLRTALFGGCWGGSSGGFGCGGGQSNGGGTWGSNGGGFGSTGSYVSSGGCVGSLAASAPVSSLPSLIAPVVSNWDLGSNVAASNLGLAVVDSVPSLDSFDGYGAVSAYQTPSSAIPVSQYETSAPVLDYGYAGSGIGVIGAPTDASMINGNIITGPMLEVSPGGTTVPAPGIEMNPGFDSPPSSIQSGGDDDIGAIEDEDSASLQRRSTGGTAILTIDVPQDSVVYVNDRLTNTKGTRRSYASRNLKPGEQYRYRVRVVSTVNGRELVKNDTIVMEANDRELLAFDFKPVITRLVVKVPEDAKVTIDGSTTEATGTYRSFSTRKLASGKWDDYSVEVSVVRDGKTLTQRRQFDLVAGQFRFLPFDFDGSSTDVATK